VATQDGRGPQQYKKTAGVKNCYYCQLRINLNNKSPLFIKIMNSYADR
jgi:hypothetical protein